MQGRRREGMSMVLPTTRPAGRGMKRQRTTKNTVHISRGSAQSCATYEETPPSSPTPRSSPTHRTSNHHDHPPSTLVAEIVPYIPRPPSSPVLYFFLHSAFSLCQHTFGSQFCGLCRLSIVSIALTNFCAALGTETSPSSGLLSHSL